MGFTPKNKVSLWAPPPLSEPSSTHKKNKRRAQSKKSKSPTSDFKAPSSSSSSSSQEKKIKHRKPNPSVLEILLSRTSSRDGKSDKVPHVPPPPPLQQQQQQPQQLHVTSASPRHLPHTSSSTSLLPLSNPKPAATTITATIAKELESDICCPSTEKPAHLQQCNTILCARAYVEDEGEEAFDYCRNDETDEWEMEKGDPFLGRWEDWADPRDELEEVVVVEMGATREEGEDEEGIPLREVLRMISEGKLEDVGVLC